MLEGQTLNYSSEKKTARNGHQSFQIPSLQLQGQCLQGRLAGQGLNGLPNRTKSLASAGTFSGLWRVCQCGRFPSNLLKRTRLLHWKGNKSIFSVSGTLVSQ